VKKSKNTKTDKQQKTETLHIVLGLIPVVATSLFLGQLVTDTICSFREQYCSNAEIAPLVVPIVGVLLYVAVVLIMQNNKKSSKNSFFEGKFFQQHNSKLPPSWVLVSGFFAWIGCVAGFATIAAWAICFHNSRAVCHDKELEVIIASVVIAAVAYMAFISYLDSKSN
jgi:hypothetical protein